MSCSAKWENYFDQYLCYSIQPPPPSPVDKAKTSPPPIAGSKSNPAVGAEIKGPSEQVMLKSLHAPDRTRRKLQLQKKSDFGTAWAQGSLLNDDVTTPMFPDPWKVAENKENKEAHQRQLNNDPERVYSGLHTKGPLRTAIRAKPVEKDGYADATVESRGEKDFCHSKDYQPLSCKEATLPSNSEQVLSTIFTSQNEMKMAKKKLSKKKKFADCKYCGSPCFEEDCIAECSECRMVLHTEVVSTMKPTTEKYECIRSFEVVSAKKLTLEKKECTRSSEVFSTTKPTLEKYECTRSSQEIKSSDMRRIADFSSQERFNGKCENEVSRIECNVEVLKTYGTEKHNTTNPTALVGMQVNSNSEGRRLSDEKKLASKSNQQSSYLPTSLKSLDESLRNPSVQNLSSSRNIMERVSSETCQPLRCSRTLASDIRCAKCLLPMVRNTVDNTSKCVSCDANFHVSSIPKPYFTTSIYQETQSSNGLTSSHGKCNISRNTIIHRSTPMEPLPSLGVEKKMKPTESILLPSNSRACIKCGGCIALAHSACGKCKHPVFNSSDFKDTILLNFNDESHRKAALNTSACLSSNISRLSEEKKTLPLRGKTESNTFIIKDYDKLYLKESSDTRHNVSTKSTVDSRDSIDTIQLHYTDGMNTGLSLNSSSIRQTISALSSLSEGDATVPLQGKKENKQRIIDTTKLHPKESSNLPSSNNTTKTLLQRRRERFLNRALSSEDDNSTIQTSYSSLNYNLSVSTSADYSPVSSTREKDLKVQEMHYHRTSIEKKLKAEIKMAEFLEAQKLLLFSASDGECSTTREARNLHNSEREEIKIETKLEAQLKVAQYLKTLLN